ncbi:MAG: lysylphosphatidylglycerol synthase transmembrane domain-containing protein [Patescibacteria group bacterium]|nr:lysylphosphatidylglycerol synthase transmembrane domain-containing protein [Patescibacteria group bacterium]
MSPMTILSKIKKRQALSILILIIFLCALIPQYAVLRSSLALLPNANKNFLFIAGLCTALTYLLATFTYRLLAFKPLNFRRTFIVQLGAMFINRLIPSGFGALGVNFVYLKKESHTNTEAGTVVSFNNFLGLMGHLLLFGIIIIFFNTSIQDFKYPPISINPVVTALLILLFITVIVALYKVNGNKTVHTLRSFERAVLSYRRRKVHLLLALGNSILVTLSNVAILFFCMLAVGGHLSFAAIFIAFSFGVGAAAAVPTPGGIGGVEAGTAAGLVSFGMPLHTAIAAAVIYRIISFWIPLLVGFSAFIYCQRKHYFG